MLDADRMCKSEIKNNYATQRYTNLNITISQHWNLLFCQFNLQMIYLKSINHSFFYYIKKSGKKPVYFLLLQSFVVFIITLRRLLDVLVSFLVFL